MLAAAASSRATRSLEREVHSALREQLGKLADNISVDCEEGDVILMGTTTSYYHRQLAIYAAQCAAKGARIVDEIEVSYPRRRLSYALASGS
jgi:hypothetical protein